MSYFIIVQTLHNSVSDGKLSPFSYLICHLVFGLVGALLNFITYTIVLTSSSAFSLALQEYHVKLAAAQVVPKSSEEKTPHPKFSSSTPISSTTVQPVFFSHKNFLGHNINYRPSPSPIFKSPPENKTSSSNNKTSNSKLNSYKVIGKNIF